MRKLAALVVTVGFAVLSAPSAQTAEVLAADVLRARIVEQAEAHGVAPAKVLGLELSLSLPGPNGGARITTLTVDELIERIAGRTRLTATGPLPVVANAGDVSHFYLTSGFGVNTAYGVSRSALVPSTPPAILPPPAFFWDSGGQLTQVKGSYDSGLHSANEWGGGLNVDSTGTNGFVSDTSLDFTGHVLALSQARACIPFINYCVATGILLGDGATLFDNTLPASTPTIP